MLVAETRHAVRRLRSRAFRTSGVTLITAVAIGTATAAFSVADATLFRPAPYKHADRLISQTFSNSEPALMQAWRDSARFDYVEASFPSSVETEVRGTTYAWQGVHVTPGTLTMLGASPAHGRLLQVHDELLLSERIWRSAFQADRSVIGQSIRWGGETVRLVGVLPDTFRFPVPSTLFWRSFVPRPGVRALFTLHGRLKAGVDPKAAETQLLAMGRQIAQLPRNYVGGPPVRRAGESNLDPLALRASWFLIVSAGFVFFALCGNASALALADLSRRRQELVTCTALGASRARLVREIALEFLVPAVAGTVLGLGLAWILIAALPATFSSRALNAVDLDGRAFLAAAAMGIASLVAAGVVPAWLQTSRQSMTLGESRGTQSGADRLTESGVLIAQIGLGCVLLVGAATCTRSLLMMTSTDRGLDADGVLRLRIAGLDDAFGSADRMMTAIRLIESKLAALHGVSEVALSREVPPWNGLTVTIQAEGWSAFEPEVEAVRYRVDPSFFKLYGISLVRGRFIGPGDDRRAAVVSQGLAERLWPGQDPVGRPFLLGRQRWHVVGVAKEILFPSLDTRFERPEVFVELGPDSRTLYASLRCAGICPDEKSLAFHVHGVHPRLSLRLSTGAEEMYQEHLELPRANARVATLLAAIGLVAAGIGVFTALATAIVRRKRELGIRIAVGASSRQIRRLVLRLAVQPMVVGVPAGLVTGWLLLGAVSALVYGLSPFEPWILVTVATAFTFLTLLAAWQPARVAAGTDPAVLLRGE